MLIILIQLNFNVDITKVKGPGRGGFLESEISFAFSWVNSSWNLLRFLNNLVAGIGMEDLEDMTWTHVDVNKHVTN